MLPPGPRSPALWQTYQFVKHPREYARAIKEKHGNAATFKSLLGTGIAVFEPQLAREVFAAPPETFATAGFISALFGKHAVIVTSGPEHRRQRKLLNPRFHGARMKNLYATMQRVVRDALHRGFDRASKSGETIVVADLSQQLALDLILETVFGHDRNFDRANGRRILDDIGHAFVPSLVGGSLLHNKLYPPWRHFLATRAAFDAWVDELVRERRQRGDLGDDLLGTLLDVRYDDNEPMSDEEIRDQLLTLLMAGHETSAIALAWGVYHLARNPEVLARLRKELDALGPDPSPDALAKQPYLGAVVSETLRIEPIVTDVVRVLKSPYRVAGKYDLVAGQVVAVMLVTILEDPKLFPEPTRFRPERFLERSFGAAEFLPFGGGARRCLGSAFAEAELSIALASIVLGWDFALASGEPERAVRRNITMGPEHGVRLRVTGRRMPVVPAHA